MHSKKNITTLGENKVTTELLANQKDSSQAAHESSNEIPKALRLFLKTYAEL
jgi:hypothetical protein